MKTDSPDRLPEKLRRLRHFHLYPQKYLAARLGVSQVAYSKMERGLARVSEIHLKKIAALYGVESEELNARPAEALIRQFSLPPQ